MKENNCELLKYKNDYNFETMSNRTHEIFSFFLCLLFTLEVDHICYDTFCIYRVLDIAHFTSRVQVDDVKVVKSIILQLTE